MAKQELNPDEVIVKSADIRALMDRIDTLEKGVVAPDPMLEEVDSHTVGVRYHEGRPVSHISDVVRTGKFLTTGEERMSCKLFVLDEKGNEEEVEADYLEFIRNAPIEVCNVIEIIDKPWKIVQDSSEIVRVVDHRSERTGTKVPNVVKGVTKTYVVQLKDGRKVTLRTPNL